MEQQRFSEIESGKVPIPKEALVSVLAVLRSLPRDTDKQRILDFERPLDDLRTEAELIRNLVAEIAPRMGTGEPARVLGQVCGMLLGRQQAILEILQTRIGALPERAN